MWERECSDLNWNLLIRRLGVYPFKLHPQMCDTSWVSQLFGKLFYYFFTWLLRTPMTFIKLYAEMNGLEPSNNKIVIVVIYLGSQSCLFQFGYISISCGYPRSIPTRDLIIFLRQILLPNRIASFSRNSHYKLLSQTGVPNNFLWQHYKNVATFIWSTLLRGV